MTCWLVMMTPLGSMTKPDPRISFGSLGTDAAAFIAEVGAPLLRKTVMLTTPGSRLLIRVAWLSGMICVCCAVEGAAAASSSPIATADEI